MANDPPFSGPGNDLNLPINPADYVNDIEDNFAKCKDEIIGLNTKIDNRTGPSAVSYIEVQDEGIVVPQSPFSKINFIGPAVSAVDFDDERVDVTIGSDPVELWFPAIAGLAAFGDYQVGGNAAALRNITGFVPTDFVSLISVELVYIKNGTNAVSWTLNSDYGAPGEAYNNHSQAAVTLAVLQTDGFIYTLDLSAVLSLIAAGDFFGIGADPGQSVRILGIRFIYSKV